MPTIPAHERHRLAALDRYAVDALPAGAFDRLTRLTARLFGAPAVMVSLVGAEHVAFRGCYGLDLRQMDRSLGFCTAALQSPGVLTVPDLARDARFAGHPMVVDAPHARFYAGAPLVTPDGHTLGTLCVLDWRPRPPLTADQQATLGDLAGQVVGELELHLSTWEAGRAADANARLSRERQDALDLARLLGGIGSLADLDLSPEDMLPHVARLTGAALDVDWAGLSAVVGDTAAIRSAWHSPAGTELARRTAPSVRREHGGLLWRAAEEERALFSSDYAREHGRRADLAAAGVRSLVSVGLGQVGAARHALTLARLSGRPWSARDRQLVDAVGRAVRHSLTASAGRAAVRESEARLSAALHAAPVILWTTDLTGTFTLSQGRALRQLGLSPGEVVGRAVRDVFAAHPDIPANVERALGGESFTARVAAGGRVFEASYAPLLDGAGRQVGTIGTGYDVTETVRAQQETTRAHRQAQALLDLSRALEADGELAHVAGAALSAIGRALEESWLVLWRREGDTLWPLALHGEVPAPARKQHAGGVPAAWFQRYGLQGGRGVFLTAADLPREARDLGVGGMALLALDGAGPGREAVLAASRPAGGAWTSFERGLLTAAARTLAVGLGRHDHLRSLEADARTDTLTGLGNRRAFELDLNAELSRARRHGTAVGLLSIDLDGLKGVNDTGGHARGDALLREFARSLRRCLRAEDRVHRLGGDEYVVVLPEVDPEGAAAVLARVGAAVEATRDAGFAAMDASAGLACFPAEAQEAGALIHLSDARMYAAKAGRRTPERAAASPDRPGSSDQTVGEGSGGGTARPDTGTTGPGFSGHPPSADGPLIPIPPRQ